MIWIYIGIVIAVLIVAILIGKAASGFNVLFKIFLFPFIALYNIFNFIFKK